MANEIVNNPDIISLFKKKVSDHDKNLINHQDFRRRDIQVNATGESSVRPDRIQVKITVVGTKSDVQEVKNSVSRRFDYIIKIIHFYKIKEDEFDVNQSVTRVESGFKMVAEVTVTLQDFLKCQSMCNLFVEKLDSAVTISKPRVFHSPQRLEALRQQACLIAVRNARQKALQVAEMLHQSLGPPLNIREEDCQEWDGTKYVNEGLSDALTLQQQIALATITARVKVQASFEIGENKQI